MEGWGFLQPPSLRDIRGRGGATKGLSAPPPPLTHLVVLDFEWTADDRRKMEPCSEITQFPSVLVRLDGHASVATDQFDTFVRPVYNPQLTPFAVGLTAITQADVDAAPTLVEVLPRYLEWLRGHGLVDAAGRRLGSWCVCTWSDADIGGQLSSECRHKDIAMPACFDAWVDLKLLYRRHYRTAPSGGLRACVERLGLTFEGRAHNGLVKLCPLGSAPARLLRLPRPRLLALCASALPERGPATGIPATASAARPSRLQRTLADVTAVPTLPSPTHTPPTLDRYRRTTSARVDLLTMRSPHNT